MERANFIPAPHYFNLNQACSVLNAAFYFSVGIYLVGSSLERRDYRDVDVRCILPDAEFERLFGSIETPQFNALWSVMCSTISLWMSKHTDLPIDFQVQKMSKANEEFKGEKRVALGIFVHETREATEDQR